MFCLGPRGRTQTDVYFVAAGPSWVLIEQTGLRVSELLALTRADVHLGTGPHLRAIGTSPPSFTTSAA
ncbi:MAG: hypothetical protein M3P44_12265 [Actinomycetota bacterium]|nr:hypothetical protein [Actinomycetota bacterium]